MLVERLADFVKQGNFFNFFHGPNNLRKKVTHNPRDAFEIREAVFKHKCN
jgi:hypothetical protein